MSRNQSGCTADAREKPRLLMLSTNADRAGAPRHLCELTTGIREHYEVMLGVGGRGYLTDCMNRLGIPLKVIPNLTRAIRPGRDLLAYLAIRKLVQAFRPQLVHVHSSKAGVLGRLAAYRLGIPAVFTAHGWPFAPGIPPLQRFYSLPVERVMAGRTRVIITVSEHDRQLAIDKGVAESDRLVTIHNGIADMPLRADPGAEGSVRLAMVARFTRQKDHDCLIQALRLVASGVKCILAGNGPLLAGAVEEVAAVGLEDRIELPGEIADVGALLASCHLFVLSSRWEGLPISILEAMRAGLPVVASDVGGVREAVIDGETGFLVPSGDPRILADRIDRLVGDAGMRARMGRAGRGRYEKKFTAKRMVEATESIYAMLSDRSILRQQGFDQDAGKQV